jgi:hypothetical protein
MGKLSCALSLLQGNIVANVSTFPSGMMALANYVHGKGLKLGIYNYTGHRIRIIDEIKETKISCSGKNVDNDKSSFTLQLNGFPAF